MAKKIPLILAFIHLVSVFVIGYGILNSLDSDAGMLWLVYLLFDFPASLGIIPLSYLIDGTEIISKVDAEGNYQRYRDIKNFWYPALYNGIVGTLWWYYFPKAMSKLEW